MLPHSNGKNRRRKRGKRSTLKRPQAVLCVLPAILLLGVWLLLARQVNFTGTSTAQVSPERLELDPLLPMPLVVERGEQEHGDIAAGRIITDKSNSGNKRKQEPQQPQQQIHNTGKQPVDNKIPNKKQRVKYTVEVVDEQETDETSFMIPNVITFTHSINLLNATKVTGEDVALQRNVLNTIKLHPGAQVHFLTDDDCIASIQRVLGQDSPLVKFFRDETHGMYKADVCRGASLYETGGLYFDVDLQARMSMWDAVSPETNFVTPMVHRQSKYPGAFFQAFIGTSPKNPILWRYLQLFLKHYQGHIDVQGPLGVLLLRRAHDEVMKEEKHSLKVELWQEVLYNKQLFPNVPPPSWGTRRACHFVVVSNRKRPYIVPLYSRVKGSRMCGGKESVKNLRGG